MIHVIDGNQLVFRGQAFPCAIGKNGLTDDKKEGDGATPIGQFTLLKVLYRSDRLMDIETDLPIQAIKETDGWCDDPAYAEYNQPIDLPFTGSHEKLWRDDTIYDVIVVLDHNQNPTVSGKGSAIFFHLARPDYSGTEGCIAISLEHMRAILKDIQPGEQIKISPLT